MCVLFLLLLQIIVLCLLNVYYTLSFENFTCHLIIYDHFSEILVKISSFLKMKPASKMFSKQDDLLKDRFKKKKKQRPLVLTIQINGPD